MNRYSKNGKYELNGKFLMYTSEIRNLPDDFDYLYYDPSYGESLENIAYKLYGNSSYYYVLMLANPEMSLKNFVTNEESLRYPRDIQAALAYIHKQ